MREAPTVLDRIVRKRQERLEAARQRRPLHEVRAAALAQPPARDFAAAVRGGPGDVRVIAEIKRRSPSRGRLRDHVDLPALAGLYAAGGAAALSVLTEEDHFGGSLEDLAPARRASGLPVLRKDFLTDPYQLYEARAAGADAVLLIVAALEGPRLRELADLAAELGLAALVEAHDEAEVQAALSCPAALIGINNRNLRTMTVELDTAALLAPLVPSGRTVVAESGIRGAADIRLLTAFGIHAFLVGEHLMLASDPAEAIRDLMGTPA